MTRSIVAFFAALLLVTVPARADELSTDLKTLATPDRDGDAAAHAVESITRRGDATALAILQALSDDNLRVDADGRAYLAAADGTLTAATADGPKAPASKTETPLVDNRLRRVVESSVASLKLTSPDRAIRLEAAEDLAKHRDDNLAPVVRTAVAKETDSGVRAKLRLALAQLDISSSDPKLQLSAVDAVRDAADSDFKPELQSIVASTSAGPDVKAAAKAALSTIDLHEKFFALAGDLFYGVSLGSVLLLASLGLAITFGLMRVINMAHGELLMIGAYTTYVVQKLFQAHFPAHADWYLVFSVPAAFVVCAAIGMILERTVVSFLYGRPLETLLATWGISLLLIQTVRLVFGAQNVSVANPSWLAGGIEVSESFVLTYSRLAVIFFSVAVVLFVWFMLQRTSLGLHVRAVTQNREMAASVGISTRWVDLCTFGIGSGVAGLGGVALSQLGNVGPELGQGYIVDSFMVVVLGGVGKLAGTLVGALGLGMANKLLEPLAGAVLGKIFILGFIILFIQRRPQGIFALKGRTAEVL